MHRRRDRVQNLYFAYLFVLRAVMKEAPVLTAYDYNTGLEDEDAQTRSLVSQLVSRCSATAATADASRGPLIRQSG